MTTRTSSSGRSCRLVTAKPHKHSRSSTIGRENNARDAGDRGGDENEDDDDDGDEPNLPSYEERRRQRQDATLPFLVHIAELDTLVHLKTVANGCRQLSRHESAWNVLVHGPLFQLALPSHINIEPVTSVSISKAFIPSWRQRTKEVLAADSKRVDFAFTLTPRDDVAAAIRAAVTAQPPGMDTVNQTATYAALRYAPVALSAETKTTSGSAEEGRAQLAVWTAAWHRRMGDFMRGEEGDVALTTTTTIGGPSKVITLPLLLIVEHEWKLSFAVDRGDSIVSASLLTFSSTFTGLTSINRTS